MTNDQQLRLEKRIDEMADFIDRNFDKAELTRIIAEAMAAGKPYKELIEFIEAEKMHFYEEYN